MTKDYIEKLSREFKNRLEETLDEYFPKLNQDNPAIRSPNHRSEALVLFGEAHIIFKDLLRQALEEQGIGGDHPNNLGEVIYNGKAVTVRDYDVGEDWEVEFDEEFPDDGLLMKDYYDKKIKDFIRRLLIEDRKRQAGIAGEERKESRL